MDGVYNDCSKTEGEQEILNSGRPTTDVVHPCPGGRVGSRTTLEAHDDGVVLLALGPGASPESTEPITSAALPLAPANTGSNVAYTDWTTAHLPSDAPVAPIVGTYAYPVDVAMAMEHFAGSAPSPAAATRSRVPSTGLVTSESYTAMLVAHISSSGDVSPAAAWNNMASAGSVTPSAAVNGVATTAYPGGPPLNLNAAAVTAGPDTNVVGFGHAIDVYLYQGMADLHPTGTAAAATAPLGGGYYYNNYSGSGVALPLAAHQVVDEAGMEDLFEHGAVSQDEVAAGAVADEPVRGGLGGLGLAAISLAMAGLIAGGVDTPVTAIALFGMLIAGVILVTVRVFHDA